MSTQQIINDMAFTYDIEKDALYKKGEERGVLKTAIRMKKAGVATADIIKFTGLTKAQIDDLPMDE